MSADPKVIDDMLTRIAAAPQLAGVTDQGNSKRDIFLQAFLERLREGGARICTCSTMDRPHTPRKGCLRRFAVSTSGEATLL